MPSECTASTSSLSCSGVPYPAKGPSGEKLPTWSSYSTSLSSSSMRRLSRRCDKRRIELDDNEVLYELHVGSFSPEGPFAGYGTPEQLSELVDAVHSLGMSVILDVVYNHLGPDGNPLPTFSDSYFD